MAKVCGRKLKCSHEGLSLIKSGLTLVKNLSQEFKIPSDSDLFASTLLTLFLVNFVFKDLSCCFTKNRTRTLNCE